MPPRLFHNHRRTDAQPHHPARCHDRIGAVAVDVLSVQGQLAEALKVYRDSLAIAERLAKLDPTNATWQDDAKRSRLAVERVHAALKEK